LLAFLAHNSHTPPHTRKHVPGPQQARTHTLTHASKNHVGYLLSHTRARACNNHEACLLYLTQTHTPA